MKNFKLELSYDGTRYNGWQKLGNTDNTIQYKVEKVLSQILGQKTEVSASGRTDAGVHARKQICSFRAETELPCEVILEQMRRYLPEDIGAMRLDTVPPDFHARYCCTGKTYVYRIRSSEQPEVFERRYVYSYPEKLNITEMRRAAALLCGTHDYAAFTSLKKSKKSTVRTVTELRIDERDGELRITASGDGFLYNMVRILVGTLLEVGTGARTADSMPEIVESRLRENAGFTVPAKGLILTDVRYD